MLHEATRAGVVIALGIFGASAWGTPRELRLIQMGPGERAWLNEAQITGLSRRAHEQGHCGGFMDVTEHPEKKPLFLRPLATIKRDPTQQVTVKRLLPELSAERLLEGVAKLSSFRSRYYQSESGVSSAAWVRDQFLALARGRSDVAVTTYNHTFRQPSVIARIQGSSKADETVIIGAHGDSINWGMIGPNPTAAAPGADDDASGVSTVLEVFRVLAQSGYRPARTIEFMTYAGEERGLLGSQDIAEAYKNGGRQVAAVLQLDMTMYPGASREIQLISDHVDRGLTDFLAVLIDHYVGVPWKEGRCGYACSDHASWTEAGYPSAFPFEAPMREHNPKIHTDEDTVALLNAGYGLNFAKLALAFAVELAAGD
jgi:leucyl aminopeptidase